MRDAFVRKLTELARQHDNLVLVTGDLGFGVLTAFGRDFPAQFLNVGVAEQNMTGVAAGLALEGKIVFTYSIGNFPTLRCLEQIRNGVCYHGLNVKIVSVGGGFSYGALGTSHHATEDLSIMRAIPELTVLAPGDPWEAAQATDALFRLPGAAYLRLDKSAAPETQRTGERFQLGKARVLREGRDVTLIAAGGIVGVALEAATGLSHEGIECRVLSMHTLKPMDGEAVAAAARETGGVVTIEENTVIGGLGGAVAEWCLETGEVPRWFHRVGLRAGFSCIVGSQAYLRKQYGMDASAIQDTVLSGLRRGRT